MRLKPDIWTLWNTERAETFDVAGIGDEGKVAFIGEHFKTISRIDTKTNTIVLLLMTEAPRWKGSFYEPYLLLRHKDVL